MTDTETMMVIATTCRKRAVLKRTEFKRSRAQVDNTVGVSPSAEVASSWELLSATADPTNEGYPNQGKTIRVQASQSDSQVRMR